jgi:broad specificity phosphatase PhoE
VASEVVVVVTHVSPIKAALAWALDVPVTIAWRTFVEDASVSRIDVGASGPAVRWFNRGLPPGA